MRRMPLPLISLLALAGVASVLATLPATASAQTPNAAQRRCILELNRAAARVVDATAREMLRCARLGVRGRLPAGQSLEACVAADARQGIAKARVAAEVAEARWCEEPPPFGARDADAVNAMLSPLTQVEAIFGADSGDVLAASIGEAARARCQVATVRGMTRIAKAKLKEFNRCTRAGLAGGTIESAEDLEACLDADPRGRVARTVASVDRQLEKSCGGQPIAALLPGGCAASAAGELAGCVERPVFCDVCTGLNVADRMDASCHRFADGVAVHYCGERPPRVHSVARLWDEELLAAIRIDTPRPVVHARNLWHLSLAMWDAWAAYDDTADLFLHATRASAPAVAEARDAAISFTAHRILRHRFAASPGAATSLERFDALLDELGYDAGFVTDDGSSPAALGNQIAAEVIAYGFADGANEHLDYDDPTYAPVNAPLVVADPGTVMVDPNRWQPLELETFIGQNGVPIPGKVQKFVGPHWRDVLSFALVRSAPGVPYFDPIPPPLLGGATDAEFKDAAVELIFKQSLLDTEDLTLIDASPGVQGNNTLGANDGTGHALNPVTGQPYAPNLVKRQDYFRVLGMFWADGPDSETPPGHWNVVANEVSDHPLFERRLGGAGAVLDDLEWDVKLYFALNGAVHDAAVACWEAKGDFDYVRPISMIRHMGGLGQSSDPLGDSYHPDGLPLVPGLIEVITPASGAAGERHEHLADFVGEIALRGWRGEPADPTTQVGGIAWIRATEWIAFQRKTFVTPPFAGFVSGHSTFSRAAAEVMTGLTGDAFFPGGLGEFVAPADVFIPPEKGPTEPTALQYATYYDAADQAGISRLWSGIHVRADDFEGRKIGAVVGVQALARALSYYDGSAVP